MMEYELNKAQNAISDEWLAKRFWSRAKAFHWQSNFVNYARNLGVAIQTKKEHPIKSSSYSIVRYRIKPE
jgi:hypothetical protein